jgi:hypothetical protein
LMVYSISGMRGNILLYLTASVKDDRIEEKGTDVKNLKLPAFRVIFLHLCLGGFLYGLLAEGHEIYSLTGPGKARISGPGFAEIATYDGAMAREGKLYDVFSIMALSLKSDEKGELRSGSARGGDSGNTKDCKT